jgi:hypothetical protein
MTVSMREGSYRLYLDYLETAETKRRWNIFNDIPWDELDLSKTSAKTAGASRSFAPKRCTCRTTPPMGSN